jgi:hypothetical protein
VETELYWLARDSGLDEALLSILSVEACDQCEHLQSWHSPTQAYNVAAARSNVATSDLHRVIGCHAIQLIGVLHRHLGTNPAAIKEPACHRSFHRASLSLSTITLTVTFYHGALRGSFDQQQARMFGRDRVCGVATFYSSKAGGLQTCLHVVSMQQRG